MNGHVSAWLEAYHDGELKGLRLRQIEAHLAQCETCRAELEQLEALSTLLHKSPAAEDLMPPDRFVAQVGLRLPRRPERTAWQQALEIGWRLVPAGLFGAWAFVQAVFVVSWIVLAALRLGVGGNLVAEWLPAARQGAWLTETFGLLGADLSNVSRVILQTLSTLGWGVTLNLAALVVIGLLYWSWLASWWVRQKRYQEGAT